MPTKFTPPSVSPAAVLYWESTPPLGLAFAKFSVVRLEEAAVNAVRFKYSVTCAWGVACGQAEQGQERQHEADFVDEFHENLPFRILKSYRVNDGNDPNSQSRAEHGEEVQKYAAENMEPYFSARLSRGHRKNFRRWWEGSVWRSLLRYHGGMSLTLELTPEQEQRLKTEAAQRGMEAAAYALTLLTGSRRIPHLRVDAQGIPWIAPGRRWRGGRNYLGGMSAEEIAAEFPHLTPASVHAALRYYDHQRETATSRGGRSGAASAPKRGHPLLPRACGRKAVCEVALYMDENVHGAITRSLRQRGVDILTVQEEGREETPDPQVLDRAENWGASWSVKTLTC